MHDDDSFVRFEIPRKDLPAALTHAPCQLKAPCSRMKWPLVTAEEPPLWDLLEDV